LAYIGVDYRLQSTATIVVNKRMLVARKLIEDQKIKPKFMLGFSKQTLS